MFQFPVIPSNTHLPYNPDLSRAALGFNQAISLLDSHGLGHFITSSKNAVSHSDPNIRTMLQSNLDSLTKGLSVIAYFSVWDHYFDKPINSTSTNKMSNALLFNPSKPSNPHWVTEEDSYRFRALKHVRHSVAHSFNGHRATQNATHFDTVMNTSEKFKGVIFTADTIDISNSQIHMDCRALFKKIAPAMVGRLTNDNPFP